MVVFDGTNMNIASSKTYDASAITSFVNDINGLSSTAVTIVALVVKGKAGALTAQLQSAISTKFGTTTVSDGTWQTNVTSCAILAGFSSSGRAFTREAVNATTGVSISYNLSVGGASWVVSASSGASARGDQGQIQAWPLVSATARAGSVTTFQIVARDAYNNLQLR